MRLVTRFLLIIFIIVSISQMGLAANGEKIIRGEIVAINNQRGIFLLKSKEQIKQYRVNLHTKIFRNGSSVSLRALRPITARDFQPALLKLDKAGDLLEVRVKYEAKPMEVKAINKRTLQLKIHLLNSDRVINIDYRPGIKVVRNNQPAEFKQVQVGDQGLIIRGLNDRIKKIQISHYE